MSTTRKRGAAGIPPEAAAAGIHPAPRFLGRYILAGIGYQHESQRSSQNPIEQRCGVATSAGVLR
jgi:hypothetical protein